jgi:cytochrome c oxidase subunit 3
MLLPLLNTVLLLASAATMYLAHRALLADRLRQFNRLLILTMLLGAGFIGGQVYEFATVGFTIQDGAYAGIFLMTMGVHAAHVAVGVLIFAVVQVRASLGLLSARRSLSVELCAIYWYFVALMWIIIFAILYFL